MVVAAALALFAAVAAGGCGFSEAPELSATAASELHRRLADVRAAAEAGDKDKALDELSAFARLVSRESRGGRLSAGAAGALKTGVAQARRRVELEIRTPTRAATPAPSTAEPAVKQHGRGHAKGKGKGKGKGKDEDEDEDEDEDKR